MKNTEMKKFENWLKRNHIKYEKLRGALCDDKDKFSHMVRYFFKVKNDRCCATFFQEEFADCQWGCDYIRNDDGGRSKYLAVIKVLNLALK